MIKYARIILKLLLVYCITMCKVLHHKTSVKSKQGLPHLHKYLHTVIYVYIPCGCICSVCSFWSTSPAIKQRVVLASSPRSFPLYARRRKEPGNIGGNI